MTKRKHPRFVAHQRVELNVHDRNELRDVWMADISKGGLFVQTDEPPALRDQVSVSLSTPDGVVTLGAEVVHVLDRATADRVGATPGVGLQFTNLDTQQRKAIESYVEGLSSALSDAEHGTGRPSVDSHAVIEVMKQVLKGFEEEDLYGAIGVPPLASDEEIDSRLRKVMRLLELSGEGLSAAQLSRAKHVRNLVRRLGALLLNPDRRLDYDLRHGYLFPRERLAVADEPERNRIRRMWHRNNPDAMPQAEKYASLAVRYEGVMKYKEAIDAATEALKHDPFNYDMWKAIDTWWERLQLADQPLELPDSMDD